MSVTLLADSGSTKCEWCLLENGKSRKIYTNGISPYFLTPDQISALFRKDLIPKLKNAPVSRIYFYGTGLLDPANARLIKKLLKKDFPDADIEVKDDMTGVARATCGDEKGIACILGTGSNSCYYNGKKITKIRTGLGYILGDEGSGAYLGKKVLQYYLYKTFDEELSARFDEKYHTDRIEILNHVYKQPQANKYIAGFSLFLAENRGHYMVENIIEDGLNDFIVTHLYKFPEVWRNPVSFSGGVAYGFRDVLIDLCHSYELGIGKIVKEPMAGLIKFHSR